MKTLCVAQSVYDVNNLPQKSNCLSISFDQMSDLKKLYRDENGSLISEVPCNWEDAVRRIQEGKFEFGR